MATSKITASRGSAHSPSHRLNAEMAVSPGYQEDYTGRLLSSLHTLRDIFSLPGNARELESLLEGLLTPQEAEEMVKRWQLLQRLLTDEPQRKIAQELGISLGTIARGSRLLKYGPAAFRHLVEQSLKNPKL